MFSCSPCILKQTLNIQQKKKLPSRWQCQSGLSCTACHTPCYILHIAGLIPERSIWRYDCLIRIAVECCWQCWQYIVLCGGYLQFLVQPPLTGDEEPPRWVWKLLPVNLDPVPWLEGKKEINGSVLYSLKQWLYIESQNKTSNHRHSNTNYKMPPIT